MEKLEPHEVERYIKNQKPEYQPAIRRAMEIVSRVLAEYGELGAHPVISYQILGWRFRGKFLLHISASKDHISFHGAHALERLEASHPQWFKLKGSTLWWQPEPELPEAVIRDVIERRIADL